MLQPTWPDLQRVCKLTPSFTGQDIQHSVANSGLSWDRAWDFLNNRLLKVS